MERLEKRRRQRNAQLRGGNKHWTIPEINKEIKAGREEMALLPSLASASSSVERKVPNVLCRSTSERRVRRHQQGDCCRMLSKTGENKEKSSKRTI